MIHIEAQQLHLRRQLSLRIAFFLAQCGNALSAHIVFAVGGFDLEHKIAPFLLNSIYISVIVCYNHCRIGE